MGDLHEQATSIARSRKHSVTKMTSPRKMLLTQAGRSQETDSTHNRVPITSSYDRSSSNNLSRGRRPFEKTSYKSSFPIRCTDTEKLNQKAKEDIVYR